MDYYELNLTLEKNLLNYVLNKILILLIMIWKLTLFYSYTQWYWKIVNPDQDFTYKCSKFKFNTKYLREIYNTK